MDIPFFKNSVYLKYSLIVNIGHSFFKDQFVITLNFANWMQDDYEEAQPEHIIGNFIFSGVKELEMTSENFIFDNNEILDIRQEVMKDSDKIYIGFEAPDPEGFVILSFKAQSVEWVPLDSYFDQ